MNLHEIKERLRIDGIILKEEVEWLIKRVEALEERNGR